MELIESWRAIDGTIFDSEEDCEFHENFILLWNKILENGGRFYDVNMQVCTQPKNSDELCNFFDTKVCFIYAPNATVREMINRLWFCNNSVLVYTDAERKDDHSIMMGWDDNEKQFVSLSLMLTSVNNS